MSASTYQLWLRLVLRFYHVLLSCVRSQCWRGSPLSKSSWRGIAFLVFHALYFALASLLVRTLRVFSALYRFALSALYLV